MAGCNEYCDEICECGHVHHWWVPFDESDYKPDWYGLDQKLESDVIERPCPHGNGTVIEHCPKCDRKVGIWGFGPAGSMECECWEQE